MGADIKYPEFTETQADVFFICDLTDKLAFDEIFTNEKNL